MSVYVDEVRDWTFIAKARGLRHTHWCHLTADTEDELHTFAKRLGLRRSWFQKKSDRDYRWHYDIVPTKRAQAVRLGAVEVDRRFIGQLMIRRQEERDGIRPERQEPPLADGGSEDSSRPEGADTASVSEPER